MRYLWRKFVTPAWWAANEARLEQIIGLAWAVIERPSRKRLLVEATCANKSQAAQLRTRFGGKSRKLPPSLPQPTGRMIRVGRRLLVSDVPIDGPHLLVPAGLAFGTGEHTTTAMSLRLLEQTTRGLTSGWRMLDAGTGSGILALAGRRFGAAEVIAIDNDPRAISTARQNGRRNRIRGVRFVSGDVRQITMEKFDIITANLYSELLISVLPRFRRNLRQGGRMILSGLLREQEKDLLPALKRNGLIPREIRRRGKWIALLVNQGAACF